MKHVSNEQKSKEIAMPCQGCECEWTKEKMYKQQYCKDCVAQDKFIATIEAMEWKEQQLIDKCKEFCDRQTTGEYYNRQGVFQIDKYIDDMLNFMKGE